MIAEDPDQFLDIGDLESLAGRTSLTCPKCGRDLERQVNDQAGCLFGLVGSLITSAFGAMKCSGCGVIPSSELSTGAKAERFLGSLFLLAGGIVILAIVLAIAPGAGHGP